MKTVYISDDGKEFSSAEACKRHESRNSIEELLESVRRMKIKREIFIAQKNAIKTNNFGFLPKYTQLVEYQEKEIKEIVKKNLKKISIEDLGKTGARFYSLMNAKEAIIKKQAELKEIKQQIIELKEEIKNAELKIAELYANKRG